MNNLNKNLLLENVENWTSKENKIIIGGSAIFYFLLIISFFIELIHFENSLGLERGFEGMGGINFLKSDSFFLIFTLSIIFLEYFLYNSYYSIKGASSRIFKEKNTEDLFERRKKSEKLQKKLKFFLILIYLIYIFDIFMKIFIDLLYQFIIIELFLHFIFCFVIGSLFFPLIMVTLDTYILNDSLYQKIAQKKSTNLYKRKKINEIFQLLFPFFIILISSNVLILIFIFLKL